MFGIKFITDFVVRRRSKAQRAVLKAHEAAVLGTHFRSLFFPLVDRILSLEICLRSVYSVDMFQGSVLPV